MRKLLVHIGSEKTGSKSIQDFLTQNSLELLDRYRILYPRHPDLFQDPGHFPIVASFLDPSEYDFVPQGKCSDTSKLSETLRKEYDQANASLMVISAEHFSSRFSEPEIVALSQTLEDFDVTIVVYVRRQDEMALSAFSTKVRCGDREWFDSEDIIPGNPYFNILQLVDLWAKYFGEENTQVLTYDKQRMSKFDVVHDFLRQLRISDASCFSSVDRMNESPTIKQLRILSLLNRFLPTWLEAFDAGNADDFEDAQEFRHWILRLTGKIESFSRSDPVTGLIGPHEKAEIVERFRSDNDSVAKKYLNKESLFSEIHAHSDLPHRAAQDMAIEITTKDFVDVLEESFKLFQDKDQAIADLPAEQEGLIRTLLNNLPEGMRCYGRYTVKSVWLTVTFQFGKLYRGIQTVFSRKTLR